MFTKPDTSDEATRKAIIRFELRQRGLSVETPNTVADLEADLEVTSAHILRRKQKIEAWERDVQKHIVRVLLAAVVLLIISVVAFSTPIYNSAFGSVVAWLSGILSCIVVIIGFGVTIAFMQVGLFVRRADTHRIVLTANNLQTGVTVIGAAGGGRCSARLLDSVRAND